MESYCTPEDYRDIAQTTTFEELGAIALRVLHRMPTSIGIVSGPISTGGTGDKQKNLKIFSATIQRLVSQGLILYDQMPFEDAMARIGKTAYFQGPLQLLEKFYLPLFESGRITTMYFMPTWHTSHGAQWEHAQAERLGIHKVYLAEEIKNANCS